jgi:hypothetical protein
LIVSRSFFGQFLPFLCHFVALPPPVLLHVFFFLIPQVPGAVTALFARLADSLAHRSRLDKEDRALELALTLVRNMLRVPDGPGCVAVAGSDSGCLDVAVWQCGCVAVAVAVAAVWLWMWQWLLSGCGRAAAWLLSGRLNPPPRHPKKPKPTQTPLLTPKTANLTPKTAYLTRKTANPTPKTAYLPPKTAYFNT